MKNPAISSQSDLLNKLIDSRFNNTDSNAQNLPIEDDFYIDLLCVFHEPKRFNAEDFQSYPLTSILLYLRQTHKLYLGKNLDDITSSIENLGKSDKKFVQLQSSLGEFFQKFRAGLEGHILEEEQDLFPYIDTLLQANEKRKRIFDWKQKARLVDFLMHHDDSHEQQLEKLTTALTNTSSFNDSFAFRMLVNRLSTFQLDLSIHAKIEEEVLMPLALELEKKVLNELP